MQGLDAPDSCPPAPHDRRKYDERLFLAEHGLSQAALDAQLWAECTGEGEADISVSAGSSSLAVLAQREAPLRVLRLLAAGANHARPRADGRTCAEAAQGAERFLVAELLRRAPPRGAPAALPAAASPSAVEAALRRARAVRASIGATNLAPALADLEPEPSPTIGAPAPTTAAERSQAPLLRTPHTATPSHARAVASSPASRLSSSGRRRSVSFTPGDVSVVVESPGRPKSPQADSDAHAPPPPPPPPQPPPPPPQPQPLAAARPPTMMARDRGWGPSSSRADADADGSLGGDSVARADDDPAAVDSPAPLPPPPLPPRRGRGAQQQAPPAPPLSALPPEATAAEPPAPASPPPPAPPAVSATLPADTAALDATPAVTPLRAPPARGVSYGYGRWNGGAAGPSAPPRSPLVDRNAAPTVRRLAEADRRRMSTLTKRPPGTYRTLTPSRRPPTPRRQ